MKNIITILVFAFITMGLVSCDQKKNDDGLTGNEPVLSLKSEGNTITIAYKPTNIEKLPRIADIYLKYDPAVLFFIGHEKGTAVTDAEKEMFAKADEKAGVLRVTVLSAANLNKIQGGILATIKFQKKGEAVATVGFDKDKQVFAPAEANDQVTFGEDVKM